ncbi:MAG TPA: hypothetical protein VGW77_27510 [Candidatus Binatia bacterium]|jgi:hypothetical protein|nr:hypothetical protein [Candidatus Binatia bacterium]
MSRIAMEELPEQNRTVFRFGFALAILVVLYVAAVIGFIIIY